MLKTRLLALSLTLFLVAVFGAPDQAAAQTSYNVKTIGLTDSEHTRDDGYKRSRATLANELGSAAGWADRFQGGNTSLGLSAWLYDGSSTSILGFTDGEHTSDTGYKISIARQLNNSGAAIGRSFRYEGGIASTGQTAWLYDGGSTQNIGLTDGEHTRDDGYKYSATAQLNESGLVIGTSNRYQGSLPFGETAWLRDGSGTHNIGLIDGEHTRDTGTRSSRATQLSESGKVIGWSRRFNGGSPLLGQSAWVRDGSVTQNIGLVDSTHTHNDGTKVSSATDVNETGWVSGWSFRYSSSTPSGQSFGQTAWLYNGTSTSDIGLSDSGHTRSDGFRNSGALQVNESGTAVGYAFRYDGAASRGQTAWLYDGTSHTGLGLTDSEHTDSAGTMLSATTHLNESGSVIGLSRRYDSGSSFFGNSAWLFDGTSTQKIGVTDSVHTRDDGFRFSSATHLNETGSVIGYSDRFAGGSTDLGQTAWVFDSAEDSMIEFLFSETSAGFAFSDATYLGDDGVVLGSYTLFDGNDTDLGSRAFYYSFDDGTHDLGSLIDGGLSFSDWELLANAIDRNGLGQIIGNGKLSSDTVGEMAYLLTSVPEPGSVSFLALLGGCLCFRRFRKAKA